MLTTMLESIGFHALKAPPPRIYSSRVWQDILSLEKREQSFLRRNNYSVKSDVRFLIFGENFLLLEGRKSIFLSASRSQLVAIGPANISKIGQRITFL